MGYSTTFRLKGKLDKQFVPVKNFHDHLEERRYRCILIATCMKPREGNNVINDAYSEIASAVSTYVWYLKDVWKKSLKERLESSENKNEVTFYGWENANEDNTWTEESLEDYFIENLFLLGVSPCSGRFEGKDDYHAKMSDVCSYVNDLPDCVDSMMNGLFIERYRDSEDADESDGYSHKFPEEVVEENV